MKQTKAEEAMRELTMMLMYLSRLLKVRNSLKQRIFTHGKVMILIFSMNWTTMIISGRASTLPVPSLFTLLTLV